MPPRRQVQKPEAEYELSDSDLDELTDDEEDDKTGVGILSGALTKPRHVTLSCRQLYELIQAGNVNLEPDYQRDVVWPESKMLGLIQSLFLNYYIPPILFAVKQGKTDAESEHRTTIDGKQRCTSIIKFMNGEIPFKSPNGGRFFYRATHGRGKLLPKSLKDRFDMIQLVAVEFDEIADTIQRDIFQRVQMGVPLSAAEKLQAIPGPWANYVQEVLKKYVTEEGTLSDNLSWDTRRAKPFQIVLATMVYCYDPNRIAKPVTSTELTKWLNRADGPDLTFRKKFEMAMSTFVSIAVNYKHIAFQTVSAKVLAPVEFWYTGFLIYSRMGTTPVAALAKQISELRIYVRKEHKDVFTNAKVVRSCYDYIMGLPPYKLGKGELVAAAEFEGDDSESFAKKRKREEREAAEDPDYRGAPIARQPGSSSAATSLRNRAPDPPQPTRQSRPAVASVPAVRPPVSSMDAGPAMPTFGGSVAPTSSAPNPYGQNGGSYQPRQQTYQNPYQPNQQGYNQNQFQNGYGR